MWPCLDHAPWVERPEELCCGTLASRLKHAHLPTDISGVTHNRTREWQRPTKSLVRERPAATRVAQPVPWVPPQFPATTRSKNRLQCFASTHWTGLWRGACAACVLIRTPLTTLVDGPHSEAPHTLGCPLLLGAWDWHWLSLGVAASTNFGRALSGWWGPRACCCRVRGDVFPVCSNVQLMCNRLKAPPELATTRPGRA